VRRSTALRVLGLPLLGVGLALLLLEIVLRVVDPPVEVFNPLHGFHDGDTRLGWRGKPDIRRRFHTLDFDVIVEHDAHGFRRPEPAPPQDARGRVLFLGDSFTWGWGVGQGEVFTDHLQRALAKQFAVDNRGVNAFGTGQELLLLQDQLRERSYEKVVVVFCGNDVVDNVDHKEHRPQFDLSGDALVPRNQPAPATLQTPFEAFVDGHSRAALFFSYHFTLLKNWLRPDTSTSDVHGPSTSSVNFHSFPGYPVTARLLQEIARLARDHGATPYLVYVPPRSELDAFPSANPYDRAVRDMVEQIARENGFVSIDVGERLRGEIARGVNVAFAHDDHWNPTGHRIVAQALLDSPLFADWPH
jgi:hypothetical protein